MALFEAPTAFGRSIEHLSPAQIYFGLSGRISRGTWWIYGVFGLFGAGLLLTALLRIAGLNTYATDSIVNLALLWPTIAVSAKRWHDRDKSAWWVLVLVIPVVGWIWALIANGLLRGTRTRNRFGEPEPSSDR